MKDVVLDLIRQFYKIRSIIRDIVVTQDKNGTSINIFPNLAANKWRLVKNDGKPDVSAAADIIKTERIDLALQIFVITNRILKDKGKMLKWKKEYGDQMPTQDDDPNILMDWNIGALFMCEVITPHEYDETQDAIDEGGNLIATKLLPAEKHNELAEIGINVEQDKK